MFIPDSRRLGFWRLQDADTTILHTDPYAPVRRLNISFISRQISSKLGGNNQIWRKVWHFPIWLCYVLTDRLLDVSESVERKPLKIET